MIICETAHLKSLASWIDPEFGDCNFPPTLNIDVDKESRIQSRAELFLQGRDNIRMGRSARRQRRSDPTDFSANYFEKFVYDQDFADAPHVKRRKGCLEREIRALQYLAVTESLLVEYIIR
ncbi:hypothetical protein [Cohnella faecalis]|uniref:Uncharacterized protein n=1 Tax=Cohnella faecalis TaxID=2315694 RepID=A0A398CL34_9BACL|nr:hypothetical protein [Cohnella faecalis]RIE01949.1 hypothetical protein D3H35_14345 [Cohnella faecalis]